MSTRDRRPDDFDAEVFSHIEHEAERLIGEGLPREEAWNTARKKFGNVTATRERFYEARRWTWLEQIVHDVRYAARSLAHSRGFTLVVVASLALGIGANTAVFSLVDAVLLKTLPVQDPQELRILTWVENGMRRSHSGYMTKDDAGRRISSSFSYPGFRRIQETVRESADVVGFSGARFTVTVGEATDFANAHMVSGNYFAVLGVRPAMGRILLPEDDRAEAPRSAMVTYGFWERRMGRDPEAVGRTIFVNRVPVTVAGVLPPAFQGLFPGGAQDLFVPLAFGPDVGMDMNRQDRWWIQAFARMRPAASEAAVAAGAQAALAPLIAEFAPASTSPQIVLSAGDRGVGLFRRFNRAYFLAVSVVAGLVLLICCVNVANLLLGRAEARRREIAVRMSIGASRFRVMRHFVTESLLLGGIGGALGLAVAWPLLDLLAGYLGGSAEMSWDARIDTRTLAFTASVSMITALLFGTLPAWRSTRVDLNPSLKEGGAGGRATGRSPLSRALVAAQVAISLVLLIGAGLLVRTLMGLTAVDVGFRADQLLLFESDPTQAGYQGDRFLDALARMRRSLEEIPGVASVGLTHVALIQGASSTSNVHLPEMPDQRPEAYILWCSDSFLDTMEIDIIAGRDLSARDDGQSELVAVVNETFMKRYLAGVDPLGQTFYFGSSTDRGEGPYRVVGVARDAHYTGVRDEVPPTSYLAYRQSARRGPMTFVIRTRIDPASLAGEVRNTVAAIDRTLPVSRVRTQEAQIAQSLNRERLLAGLVSAFGLLAAALAAIGLYGVMAYAVTRRTAEIGIRLALGATRGNVKRLILRSSVVMVAAGIAVGVGAGLAFTKVIEAFLFEVTTRDAASFAAAAALMAAIGALAAWIPARRAARVDPLTALRHE